MTPNAAGATAREAQIVGLTAAVVRMAGHLEAQVAKLRVQKCASEFIDVASSIFVEARRVGLELDLQIELRRADRTRPLAKESDDIRRAILDPLPPVDLLDDVRNPESARRPGSEYAPQPSHESRCPIGFKGDDEVETLDPQIPPTKRRVGHDRVDDIPPDRRLDLQSEAVVRVGQQQGLVPPPSRPASTSERGKRSVVAPYVST